MILSSTKNTTFFKLNLFVVGLNVLISVSTSSTGLVRYLPPKNLVTQQNWQPKGHPRVVSTNSAGTYLSFLRKCWEFCRTHRFAKTPGNHEYAIVSKGLFRIPSAVKDPMHRSKINFIFVVNIRVPIGAACLDSCSRARNGSPAQLKQRFQRLERD